MTLSKEFRDFRSSPNNYSFFLTSIQIIHIVVIILHIFIILSIGIRMILKIGKISKMFFQSLSFQTISTNNNKINRMISQQLLKSLLVLLMFSHFFSFTGSRNVLITILVLWFGFSWRYYMVKVHMIY